MRWIPLVVCHVDVVKVSIKSGMARERGSMMPRPPARKWSCVISRAWWGRTGQPMRLDRNFAMMWLVAEVKRPFQSVQVEGGC